MTSMYSTPLDVGGPGLAFVFGFGVFCCAVLPLIVLSEAVVLWLMKWGTLRVALFDSALINAVSTLVGFVFLYLSPQFPFLDFGYLLAAGGLSVIIEGGVLLWLTRHSARSAFLAATATNAVSYAGLFAVSGILALLAARPEKFPDTDIVYESSTFNAPSIGFINADGSNNVILPLDFYPVKPVWSDDGKTLYFLQVPGGLGFIYGGAFSYWREGEIVRTCSNGEWQGIFGVSPTTDSKQVILTKDTQSIVLVNIEKCQELERYLELTDHLYPYRPSASSDGRFVVFSVGYDIELRDNDTSTETRIGSGINPALSPDNQWIAYLQYDGIYVNTIEGTQEKRLIEYNAKDRALSQYEPGPPWPQWSPDGQWLIYHKCITSPGGCSDAGDYSIFKANVTTGEEIKIVDGGVYPYWRRR